MAAAAVDQRERYYAKDREEWRAWLEEHHATSRGIWLVYYKKASGKSRVAYADAVEEALCFGWIDSRPAALDEERSLQYFSPRKPRSPWSKLNKERVEKLIQQGLMTDAGLEKVEAAKRDRSWNVYDAIEELTIPEDLKNALTGNRAAQQYFEAFSASAKKQLFWWIESAKRAETREKRIERLVAAAAENENPLYRRPEGKR